LIVAEDGHGAFVEFSEEFAFPTGPGAGADALDVGGGKDVEHAEHFLGADLSTETDEEGGVGDIASEGLEGHHEVFMDEEDDGVDFAGREIESGGDIGGDACADIGMVFFVAFADVVEE